ncbi:RluA family pseudouridine synthase [Coralliovum pocilloporae]|uniref:RluA family pseudouridine synthase n=1 Tax=Coralliovum pocilloporae TaxID=3066369 RepID=UPI003D9C594F
MAGVISHEVKSFESGMRLDRWFKEHYPGLSFGQLQKLVRTGQVRVDGARVKTSTRVASGQTVRIPPLATDAKDSEAPKSKPKIGDGDKAFIESILLHDDKDVMVLNKPAGLSVQGGSGTTRHVDGMLEAFRDRNGQKPRLVHRLDKDTSGVLVVAKTRSAASFLAKAFRSRTTKKTYWALVRGVPKPKQGRISTYLTKDEESQGERMRVARHGEDDASHALTHYNVIDQAGQKLSWLSLKPVSGRTHQLRVHTSHIGHPIIGDPKYFEVENWELPAGLQNRLHLLARRIVIPHPKGGTLDVTAPLPPHMEQSWNLLALDAGRFDADPDEDGLD